MDNSDDEYYMKSEYLNKFNIQIEKLSDIYENMMENLLDSTEFSAGITKIKAFKSEILIFQNPKIQEVVLKLELTTLDLETMMQDPEYIGIFLSKEMRVNIYKNVFENVLSQLPVVDPSDPLVDPIVVVDPIIVVDPPVINE